MKIIKRVFLIVFVFLFIAFLSVQNSILQITEYVSYSNEISKDIRILQLSDLHNAYFGEEQERLVKKIQEVNPDVIFMTGDMIDYRDTTSMKDLQPCLDIVRGLNEQYPIYYITGNHEAENKYWLKLRRELLKLNVVVLENESINFNDEITITGMDDYAFFRPTRFTKTVKALSNKVEKNKLNLLLSHRPHYLDTYEEANFDYVFSGHAHGGQIRIPFIFPNGMYAPGQDWFPKYTRGVHEIAENVTLIVSRGLGNSRFPLRFLNYPNIVVLDIKAKN